MSGRETRIGDGVTASLHGEGDVVLALAPGAGGSRRTPALVALAEALAATGRRVLLYNFPYTDAGRRAPDPPARLEATVRAVAAHAREALGARRLVLGGRSMGGRMASQAVAQGLEADGLLLLAYPLHPPGQPDRLRDAHLGAIRVPMLFVQGTRDPFARPDLLAGTLQRLGSLATLHAVEGGDHSFAVRGAGRRAAADVGTEVASAAARWLDALGP